MNSVPAHNQVSLFTLIILVLGSLITGFVYPISLKEQDIIRVDGKLFFHPLIQTFLMFFAQFIVLLTFLLLMKYGMDFKNNYVMSREEARRTGAETKPNVIHTLLPAFIDLVGATLQFISIWLIKYPSTYIMIRGGVPVITAIFSVVFLKQKLYPHHTLGLVLVLIGVALVGVVEGIEEDRNKTRSMLGLIFVIASLITSSLQFIIEQKVSLKHYFHNYEMIGYQGMWGLFLSSIAVLVACLIPCNASSEFCYYGHFEDIVGVAQDIGSDTNLLIFVLISMPNITMFNFFGCSMMKHGTVKIRAFTSIFITIGVLLYSIFRLNQPIYWMQLLGFFILSLGSLISQEIIEIPGANQYTREQLEKKALLNESLAIGEEDEDY